MPHVEDKYDSIVPTWNSFSAVISSANVPKKKVGFLPIIPYPATNEAAVYTAMKNFQDIRKQLRQEALPIVCDEGIYHTAATIKLLNPE